MPPRLTIDVGEPLHRKVDESWKQLVDAQDEERPTLLVRGSELCRLGSDGRLQPHDVDSLSVELDRVVQFERSTARGTIDVDPPSNVVRGLLSQDAQALDGACLVDRVVDVPVLGPHGDIIDRPGHHPESRLYYRPARGLEGVRVPRGSVPDLDSLVRHRELLLVELLGDFNFVDEASRANALGLLLLPFLREFIGDDPTPMHGVFAPEPGSGKGYLAQACLVPGCGLVAPHPGAGKDDAEWRKVITSALLAGTPAVVFDNLTGTLGSPSLAAALTTGHWTDRVLGASRQVTLPVRNAWVATGNNLDLTDEQARRVVPIFLDPGETRPSDRPRTAFRHPDLHRWALSRRRHLVHAALALVRHWLDGPAVLDAAGGFARDGGPTLSAKTRGSFDRYVGVTAAVLEAADVRGFWENSDVLEEQANDEHHEAVALLEAWHASGVGKLRAGELVRLAQTPDHPIRDAVPAHLDGASHRDLSRGLAVWLREHRDRRMGGYRLRRDSSSSRASWFVQRLDR